MANARFVASRGMELLRDPRLNKSTAFTEDEREELGLTGLLPAGVDTEQTQIRRALQQIGQKPTDLERYIYLIQLIDSDETLFYRMVMSDPARFLPILYDPTVGEACLKFGHIFRRPRGMYLSIQHRGRMREVLENWPAQDVRVICVTAGERILGLGDLGVNGMGIPIGKLALYTACAACAAAIPAADAARFRHQQSGTAPRSALPGPAPAARSTDGRTGLRGRVCGSRAEVFSRCCIHCEDFAGRRCRAAARALPRSGLLFNDDIQGTAGVALAGVLSGLR